MFDALFKKEPQYDENGRLVGYSQPKIVWIIVAVVLFYCCKDKLMKQKGGSTNSRRTSQRVRRPSILPKWLRILLLCCNITICAFLIKIYPKYSWAWVIGIILATVEMMLTAGE